LVKTLVIFSGQHEGSELEYSGNFETKFKKFSPPDEVVFLYPNYLQESLSGHFEVSSAFYENISRFGKAVPITLLPFDKFGQFKPHYLIQGTKLEGIFEDLHSQIAKNGLLRLAEGRRNKIIVKAPSGTTFSKPSERLKSEFIKASELAVGYSECQFVAYCLLTKAPKELQVKSIYIDSASISMYVEALLYYWNKFDNAKCKNTKYYSFGSYEGMSRARPDVTSNIWVVISASSTNGLGIKIAKEWNLEHEQVLTMLSFNDSKADNLGDMILVNIVDLSDSETHENNYGSLIHVGLIGENFTAEIEKPNPIMITADHNTNEIRTWITGNRDNSLIDLGHFVGKDRKSCSIYINAKKHIETDATHTSWIKKTVEWNTLFNIKWIIYDARSEASKLLAEQILRILLDKNILGVELIDSNGDLAGVTGTDSAFIVSAVVRTGKSFLNINRKLRLSQHSGHRTFISIFSIFTAKENFLKFKNSVCYSPNDLKYNFIAHHCAYIGHSEGKNSWELELPVLESLEHKFWRKREDLLRKLSDGIKSKVGISTKGSDKKLVFTKDFAFWKGCPYEPNKVDHDAVYLTISSILQGLREKPYTDRDRYSLQAHVYQHSVISPENFRRYNDPLLHSCLWRCAYIRELDYRSSPELSELMCEIVKDLIEKHLGGEDTAILDIFMGICTGKIQIYKEHLKDLLNHSRERFDNYDIGLSLLDFLDRKYFPKDGVQKSEDLPF